MVKFLLLPLPLILLLGAIHVCQAQETQSLGPWRGYWLRVLATAYSPHDALDAAYHATKGERWRWITADGRTDVRKVPYGIAASSLPFGTRVFIPANSGYLERSRTALSDRVFAVSDRGSTLNREATEAGCERIDLRYRTEYSAIHFGRRDLWIFVIQDDVK